MGKPSKQTPADKRLDDLEVILSARSGIRPAIAEAEARGLTY